MYGDKIICPGCKGRARSMHMCTICGGWGFIMEDNKLTKIEGPTPEDYEHTLADYRRLTRELDVLLNGEEGAAKQASLCDIVGQVRDERWMLVRRPI